MSVGYPDWGGNATLAQGITAINVPTFTITPGSSHSWVGQISRIGYEIEIGVSQLAATAQSSPIEIQLLWQDSVSLAVTAMQRWFIFPGTFNTGHHFVIGQGPSAANLLTVFVANANAAGPSVDVSLTVQDVARVYTRHDWRSRDDLFPAFQNFAVTDHDEHANMLAAVTNLALPLSTNAIFLLPLFSGEFQIKAFFTGTGPVAALIETVAHSNPNLNGTTWENDFTGGNSISLTGYMPRVQCQLKLENKSTTAAANAFVQVIVAENT